MSATGKSTAVNALNKTSNCPSRTALFDRLAEGRGPQHGHVPEFSGRVVAVPSLVVNEFTAAQDRFGPAGAFGALGVRGHLGLPWSLWWSLRVESRLPMAAVMRVKDC